MIKKSKKWQIEKLETSETSDTSEFFFRVFFSRIFDFWFWVKIKKSEEKKPGKKFEVSKVSEVSEFSTWLLCLWKMYTDKKFVWFKHFPWISWTHYRKILLRSLLIPNENQKPNHYFQIFSVTKFLRTGWIKQAFRTEHLSTSYFKVRCF